MTKPEPYKGDDAVEVKCVKDYTVKAGSGAMAGDDVEYKAGSTYKVAPRSATHLLRKVYAQHAPAKEGQTRGKYVGDANFFIDAKAAAAQAKAEKAEAAAKKADDADGADTAGGKK